MFSGLTTKFPGFPREKSVFEIVKKMQNTSTLILKKTQFYREVLFKISYPYINEKRQITHHTPTLQLNTVTVISSEFDIYF